MTAQSRAIDRIVRICASDVPDDRSLRVAILNEIRSVIAFDAFVWLLTDPETEVGSSPLADVPCLPELPRLIMLKYLTPINRWTRVKGAVARLHESTGGRLERSLVWKSLQPERDAVPASIAEAFANDAQAIAVANLRAARGSRALLEAFAEARITLLFVTGFDGVPA